MTLPLHGLRWNIQTGRLAPTPEVRKLMAAADQSGCGTM